MMGDQFDNFLDRGATAALYSHPSASAPAAGDTPRSSSSDFTASERDLVERLSLSENENERYTSPPPGFYNASADQRFASVVGAGSNAYAPHAQQRQDPVVSPPPPPSNNNNNGRSSSRSSHGGATANRLVHDLYEWLCRRPEGARHIGTNSSDDGGATFSEFYAEYPQHSAKRKCKGSGIKHVVETHGAGYLEWIDSGTCGMGSVRVVPRTLRLVVSRLPWQLSDVDVCELFQSRGVLIHEIRDRHQSGSANILVTDPASIETARRLAGTTLFYGPVPGQDSSSGGMIVVSLPETPGTISSSGITAAAAAPPTVVSAGRSGGHPPPSSSSSRASGASMNGRRPTLTVTTTRSFGRPAVIYAVPCKNSTNCQYGDKCRYAHTAAELDAARRRHHNVISPVSTTTPPPSMQQPSTPHSAPPGSMSSARENELRRVLAAATIEDKWLPHLLRHELDVQALLYCEESDFNNLGLPIGPTVKLKNWCAIQRRRRRES